MWKAPVSVTADKTLNPPVNQEASAAVANPGAQPVDVTATLYDQYGSPVTTKNLTIPAQGVTAFVFSQDPNGLFGGFGQSMFPQGTDFNGWVTFQVNSPSDGAITLVVLQVVGDSMSSANVQAFPAPVVAQQSVVGKCAEFQSTSDGRCMLQDLIPWVAFGGGWESRLKIGNIPGESAGGSVQVGFTLVPALPVANGQQNHMAAFFTDNRVAPPVLQLSESATYLLAAGESVDVRLLYPPAGCDIHGLNCGSTPDPSTLFYGSLLVRYVAADPAYLRGLAKTQVTFLAQTSGRLYGWQAAELEVAPAKIWKAPVSVTADKTVNPLANQEASTAIANPGAQPVNVTATLYDPSGAVVTSKDLIIPAQGVTAFVFSQDANGLFGGFGAAMFPRGMDFNGWVTFQVTSPSDGAVTVVVLQVVGDSMSSVDVQSFQ
jgi:hypothetical protein